jgi:hypothetical protein
MRRVIELAATAAPATPDWWARGIAIGAAVIALVALGWNVFSWWKTGPVLKVRATCEGRGDQMRITGRLTNTGRASAHIDGAQFAWHAASPRGSAPGAALRWDLSADRITGITFGQELAAHDGHEFVIDLDGMDVGLSVALHDRRRVRLSFFTASGRWGAGTQVRYR